MNVNPSLNDRLAPWGLGPETFALKALARNLGLLSRADQHRLARTRVAIAGMGGVGGIHLMTLARVGVGAFSIADFDRFEPANFNRQVGARVDTLGQPKTQVMHHEALNINPYINIRVFDEGVHAGNVDQFLEGADVFLDGLDFFAPATRRLLFQKARERKIPAVTAGPIGFGTSALVFHPDGMSFDDYFDLRDDQDEIQQLLRFYVGLVPHGWFRKYTYPQFGVRLNSKTAPSITIGCLLASAMAGTEVVRLSLNRGEVRKAPRYFQFDGYLQKMKIGTLRWGNRGPVQRMKLFLGYKMLDRQQRLFRSRAKAPTWDRSGPIPEPVLLHLLEAGLQAPSGDNLQPWIFCRREQAIGLLINGGNDKSFFNFNERATLISLGMVADNIRIAATEYGLETTVHVPPNPAIEWTQLTFSKTSPPLDPLTDVLWERNTNRRPHEKRIIPPHSLDAMTSAVESSGGQLLWATDRERISALAEMSYWADRARVVIRDCHETLYDAFRNNAEEAQRRGDGFSFGNLLARPEQRLFAALTRPWPVMRFANRIGLGDAVAKISRDSMLASAGIALILMPTDSNPDVFHGGKAFNQAWLTATLHGLALQPMASLPLFWSRWKTDGENAFPEEARPHIPRAMAILRTVFEGVDFNRQNALMIFRVGFAAEIPEGTFRRPLSSFLKGEGGRRGTYLGN